MRRTTGLTVACVLIASSAHAVQYVDVRPLASQVTAAVRDCAETDRVEVPLITWGGDIATIFANGNQRDTAPDSLFGRKGLKLRLAREDVLASQLEAYVGCRSPYLRGTLGMVNMASEVAARDPRTEMVPIYQMTWSAGGDALVVKDGIKTPKDLKGRTIALQAYGPHVDYFTKMVADAGLTTKDVEVKWLKDLVGVEGNTPGGAFREDKDVDAAFVIIPDALALTSNGTVGTGAEDSVRGATILLSTKTANRIIADVYVVRRDWLRAHPSEVESFVHGLLLGEEELRRLVGAKASRTGDYDRTMQAAAEILLDSRTAVADAAGMYADAEFVGWAGNVRFFGDPNHPRNLSKLTQEIQTAFLALGLVGKRVAVDHARWDYARLKEGLSNTGGVEAPRFDADAVAQAVAKRQQQGTLQKGELFAFEVYFRPNQNSFSADLYGDSFDRVIELASTYGGALITIEGHSDPLGYLRAKKEGQSELVLRQLQQAAKNLSLARANAVRDSVVERAKARNVTIDPTQLAVVGHGIARPHSGTCGADPCAPKTEQDWLNNMRVEFRIIQVEAESNVFKPL